MIKEHPIYKNFYANEQGEVFHYDYKLKTRINKYGYEDFNFVPLGWERTKKKHFQVHRFMWECFNGLIEGDLTINHKDNVATNNTLSNLELLTRVDNTNLRILPSKTGIVGVTLHKDGGYTVRKSKDGKRKYLGYFKCLDDAKNALKGG